jgi:hypothetical protein
MMSAGTTSTVCRLTVKWAPGVGGRDDARLERHRSNPAPLHRFFITARCPFPLKGTFHAKSSSLGRNVLPSDSQGIQADGDVSRKLGLQTRECWPNRRGPRRLSEKRMRSRVDRPRVQVVPLHRIYRHSAVGTGVRGRGSLVCNGRTALLQAGRRGAFRNPGMPHPVAAAGARINPR